MTRTRQGNPHLCVTRGASHVHRRWRRGAALPRGFVHMKGAFVRAHREEIERALNNEVERDRHDEWLGDVLDRGDDGSGGMIITTTSEQLAIRLGRALERAFEGRLLFGSSHTDQLTHVWWHRNAA